MLITRKRGDAILNTPILLGIFFTAFLNRALAAESAPAAGGGVLSMIGGFAANGIIQLLIDLLHAINAALIYLIGWAAALMQGAITLTGTSLQGINAIDVGWGITRDVANLFFIFILLIIAIATILRIETYGARNLLARLIIAALLINFSLVIAQSVIDLSNVLGNAFLAKMDPITQNMMNITGLQSTYDLREPTAKAPSGESSYFDALNSTTGYFGTSLRGFTDVSGLGTVINIWNYATGAAKAKTDALIANLVIEVLSFIYFAIAFFVFLAHAVLLVTRTVSLMLLLILAPAGFFFTVLPVTQGMGMMWWRKLFSWAFYFPAAMFLIYISVLYGSQLKDIQFVGSSLTTVSKMLNYVVISVFLIASLTLARQMGIYGASAVIGFGQKTKRYATGYAGRTAARYGWRGAGAVAGTGLVGATLGRVPLLSRAIGTAIEKGARAAQYRAGEEAKKVRGLPPEATAKIFGTFSAKGQAQAMKSMGEAQRYAVMKAIGNTPLLQRLGNNLENNGFTKEEVSNLIASGGGLHAAMQQRYNEYRDMTLKNANELTGAARETYQKRFQDLLDGIPTSVRGRVDRSEMLSNEHFLEYFLNNQQTLETFNKSREDINLGQQILRAIAYKELKLEPGKEDWQQVPAKLADILETKYGNEKLAKELRTGMGTNILLVPQEVRIGEKQEASAIEKEVAELKKDFMDIKDKQAPQ